MNIIEIKANCSNPEEIRKFLISKDADFKGKDHQIDTYFKVNFGRLKLREGKIENNLIYYNRENKEGPKNSDVSLLKIKEPTIIKEILTKAMGTLITVDKKREIYFIDNIKFHLDNVKNLGSFVEIEAIDNTGNIEKEKLLEQCKKYMELLNIGKEDLIKNSYSDLLLEGQ